MTKTSSRRDRLLILSRRTPSPVGDAAQQRAWAWVRAAADSFEVNLASVIDGPINLSQWQQLNAMTGRLTFADRHELADATASWLTQNPISACLCVSADLWPIARSLDAGVKLADLHPAHPSSRFTSPRFRFWPFARLHQARQLARQAAAECDRLILADPAQRTWSAADPARTFLVPPGEERIMPALIQGADPTELFPVIHSLETLARRAA